MMNFGKKVRIGNFEVLKLVRTLNRRDVAALRKEMGVDDLKGLERAKLPYIRVSSVSGNWGLEYLQGCSYFAFIDGCFGDDGEVMDEHYQALLNMLTMLYADTMVMGDGEYFTDKGNALNAFLGRQKKDVSDEDDAKDLESVKEEMEAIEHMESMAEQIKEEEGGGK